MSGRPFTVAAQRKITDAAKNGAVGGMLVKTMHHLSPETVDHRMGVKEIEVKDQKNKGKESNGGKR